MNGWEWGDDKPALRPGKVTCWEMYKRDSRDQSESKVGIYFLSSPGGERRVLCKVQKLCCGMKHICQGCCKLERCCAVLGMSEDEGLVQFSSSAGQIFNY